MKPIRFCEYKIVSIKDSLQILFEKIQDFFKSERAILVLCISIAFVFWLFTQLSQTQKMTVSLPLEVQLPPNKILLKKAPENIRVTLKSNGWTLLRKIARRKFEPISFSILGETAVNYQDLKNQIERKIDSKIEIVALSPTTLSFEIDEPMQKSVPILLNAEIMTLSQFRLSNEVQLLPNTIEITGPASVVENIKSVETKSLIMNDLKQTLHGEIELLAFQNNQVSLSQNKVNYIASVEQITEKILEIPIEYDSIINNIKITPINAKLICTVSLSKFNDLKSSDFKVSIDTQKVNINQLEKLPIILRKLPDLVKVEDIKIAPQEVSFFIITKKEKDE